MSTTAVRQADDDREEERCATSSMSPAGAIWDLRHQIGAPESLPGLGFPTEEIDDAADIVVEGKPVNPRPVDHACARSVIAAAHAGLRPEAFPP